MVSVFDFEKPYDTTWKYRTMKVLYDRDLMGHLPLFIEDFSSERIFRVRVGTSLSDLYDQEMEFRSEALYLSTYSIAMVKINSITSCIRYGAGQSLFVADFGIISVQIHASHGKSAPISF